MFQLVMLMCRCTWWAIPRSCRRRSCRSAPWRTATRGPCSSASRQSATPSRSSPHVSPHAAVVYLRSNELASQHGCIITPANVVCLRARDSSVTRSSVR